MARERPTPTPWKRRIQDLLTPGASHDEADVRQILAFRLNHFAKPAVNYLTELILKEHIERNDRLAESVAEKIYNGHVRELAYESVNKPPSSIKSFRTQLLEWLHRGLWLHCEPGAKTYPLSLEPNTREFDRLTGSKTYQQAIERLANCCPRAERIITLLHQHEEIEDSTEGISTLYDTIQREFQKTNFKPESFERIIRRSKNRFAKEVLRILENLSGSVDQQREHLLAIGLFDHVYETEYGERRLRIQNESSKE
jgi:hemerythrin-like domain-containing protein